MIPIIKETLKILYDLIQKKEKVNAKIVVVSKKTERDITLRLYAYPDPTEKFHTDYRILMGFEEGYNQFRNCCYVNENNTVNMILKYNYSNSPVVKGTQWFLEKFINQKFDSILEQVELYHTGKCLKCGRELTDAHSIELGIGPVCRDFN